MNSIGGLIAFFIALIWAASAVLSPGPKPIEQPLPAPIAAVESAPPESLSVASDRPTVVMVGDLSQGFGAKWLSDDAEKLRAKGWEVRSLDVQGLDETRFYVCVGGEWRIHAGQMSLGGLKAMLEKR